VRKVPPITVTSGQLVHEWHHLRRKLALRSPDVLSSWVDVTAPDCHPLFRQKPGPVASWERTPGDA